MAAGSSHNGGKTRISQSNLTTVTNGNNGDIRLRIDAFNPISLNLLGDMEGRTLQIDPAEDGMADIVIANQHSQSLFILCDGTGQDGIQKHKSTHVTRFKECLKKQRKSGQRQNPRYIEGIGTNGWGKGSVDRLTGGSIHESILRAYDDLCTKYRPGDEIHLVGFSRGAMVVRSLACFICDFGILRTSKSSIQLQAYEYWLDRNHSKLNDLAANLARGLFRDVAIETCAVWDTVSSLRFTSSLKFVEERVPKNLRYGFQALALHECRTEFMPVLWSASNSTGTIIKQTWFMGDHSDIGGGHSDDSGLANFSLLWMLSQFGETTNVEFDEQVVLKLMTPGFYYKDSFSVDTCYTEGGLHGDDSHKPLWQKPKARMNIFNSGKRVLLWQNRPQRPMNRAQIPARIEANTISAFTEYNIPLATVGEPINTVTASAKANTTIHFTAALMIQKLSYKPGLLESMELRAVEKPGAGCCRAWIDPELRGPFGIWEDRSTKWEDWMFRQWIKREEKCYGPEESDLGLSPIRSTLSGTFDALYRMRIAPYEKQKVETKRFTATLYRFRNSNTTRSTPRQVRQTSSCDGLDTGRNPSVDSSVYDADATDDWRKHSISSRNLSTSSGVTHELQPSRFEGRPPIRRRTKRSLGLYTHDPLPLRVRNAYTIHDRQGANNSFNYAPEYTPEWSSSEEESEAGTNMRDQSRIKYSAPPLQSLL